MHACALVLVVLCALASLTKGHCPRFCDCKWKGGKESVLCPKANLTRIPSKLDAGTQLLDISENPISAISKDAFLAAGLVNLQKIFITKCRVKTIDRHAFRKLINLVELDLSNNALSTVPSHTFQSIPELRELKLSGNPIQKILGEAFINVPQLVRLELSDCRLSLVDPRSFSGLEQSLEWIKLDRNRLSDIKSSTITSLINLHGLELANNPWNCTCNLRPLREWMLKQNIPFGMPPSCRFPQRVAGKSWDRMELDDFACAPNVIVPQPDTYAEEGENATLTCRIGGDPMPKVTWLLRNRLLTNVSTPGKRNYLLRSKGNSATLTLFNAETQDAGLYTCSAENVAGKFESVVKLTVAKRTGGGTSGNVVFAAGATGALVLLTICLLFFGLKTSRKKTRSHRASCRRADSYEKIEMNHKLNHINISNNSDDNNSRINETVCVGLGAIKKRGYYRNVPSQETEDEADTYDKDVETPTPILDTRGIASWKTVPQPSWPAPREPFKPEETDLHIPRLVELKDQRNTVADTLPLSNKFNDFQKPKVQNNVNNNKMDINPPAIKPRRQVPPLPRNSLYPQKGNNTIDELNNPPVVEVDKNTYPDLLELNANSSDTLMQNLAAYNIKDKRENLFCTLPRKSNIRNISRHQRDSESSQSPLLAESRYGSSGGESSHGINSNRRLSIESYSHYALPNDIRKAGQRSNSFINLSSSTLVKGGNPSLPNSPASATPLLELRGLPRSEITRTPIVTNSSAMPLTYDYHTAQLDRFLEEYRSLQDQLHKMKETCEGISGNKDKCVTNSGRIIDPLHNNYNILSPTQTDDSNMRCQPKHKPSISLISNPDPGPSMMPDSPRNISPGTDLSCNMSPWSTTNHLQRINKNTDYFRN